MILDREGRSGLVMQAFDGIVVEVDVGDQSIILQGPGINGKAMILRCNLDVVPFSTANRLVATAMAELEFVGFPSQGYRKQLMAEADTEQRHLAEQFPNVLLRVGDRLRIARAVAQENPVRAHRQNLFGRSGCRYDCHTATLAD